MVGSCEKCKYRKSLKKADHHGAGGQASLEQVDEEEGYEIVEEGGELGYLGDDEGWDGDGLEVFERVTF